ncbi:MAG TPA: hypothetical protein VFN57_20160 [Thermomicrobiaceae bacterium]|nr:hypothetical protein [Thermomicrobiaceae bacterium]
MNVLQRRRERRRDEEWTGVLRRRSRRRIALAVVAALAVVVLLLGIAGSVVLARAGSGTLPLPTGPDRIGRLRYDWVELGHTDPLASTPGRLRRLAVWIWYPASVPAGSQPAPYLPAAWQRAGSGGHGLQRLSLNTLLAGVVQHPMPASQAYADVPVAPGQRRYPVLVLMPGLGPSIPDYTVYAENLASHGYVVVGVNETDSSNLVVFADGTVARSTPAGSIPDPATTATERADANAIGRVWVADAEFVLGQLRHIDGERTSPFYGRLDLGRVGLFGHSFGGATALAVCQTDPRCRAGANLDGNPIPDTQGASVPRPFLFMTEGYPQGCAGDANCRLLEQQYRQARGPAYLVSIAGTKHFNFSDLPLQYNALGRAVLQRTGAIGAINPDRALAITNAELLAFFDRYVKGAAGTGASLLGNPAAFPEVRVTSKP